MKAYIYIRNNGFLPADFSVVMKKHVKGKGEPTFKARLAGGQLNPATVKRLRGASYRTLYISKKHSFYDYVDYLIDNKYKLYVSIKDFVEKIPSEAAKVLTNILNEYPKPTVAGPARWFNNCK